MLCFFTFFLEIKAMIKNISSAKTLMSLGCIFPNQQRGEFLDQIAVVVCKRVAFSICLILVWAVSKKGSVNTSMNLILVAVRGREKCRTR